MTGLITVGVFATIGGVMLSEGRTVIGGPVLGLAALRLVFLVRDALPQGDDDDDDDA
jgi:hypothetical protein